MRGMNPLMVGGSAPPPENVAQGGAFSICEKPHHQRSNLLWYGAICSDRHWILGFRK